ncbi:TraX family protein [Pseudomonas sp. nanlin1]|uniref:TraX family protein n=1 Tax=Pseudomonas sp. nanlin1 TaxID=3040605 RepID=UPI00388E5AA2
MRLDRPQRDHALDLLKWLALVCMVLDHLRYVGWPLEFLYVPGRLAFPWFCLAIAANLMRRPGAGLSPRYLGWMLVFAALSEIPYRMFVYPAASLNVMPTLALGLIIGSAWQQRSAPMLALAALALGGAVVFEHWLMFSVPGVLLPLVFLLVWQRRARWALLPGLFCLLGNAWEGLFASARYGDPLAISGIAACLLAPWLGMALLRSGLRWRVPALRRWAYGFYPVHFLVLLALRVLIRST